MHSIPIKGTELSIPVIGLGTWQTQSVDLENALDAALNAGYKLIDTAFNYNNEEIIGNVLKKWFSQNKLKRNEVFITTKLPHVANRACDVEVFLKKSLEKLQLNYIDLYLVHVPFGFICEENTTNPKVDNNGNFLLDLETDHIAVWKAMEQMVEMGLTKSIGLSNFNLSQLKRLYDQASIKPQVLQIELHAYLQQKPLRDYCSEKQIIVTAYSPLGSPGSQNHFTKKYNYKLRNHPHVIEDNEVKKIAEKYNKTPGQILLRHLIQNQIVVIPKSSNPNRIEENINVFDFQLNDDDINILNSLDLGDKGRIIDFFFWKGVENHPEYPFDLSNTL